MNCIHFLESVRPQALMNLPVRSTVVRLARATLLLGPGSALSETQLRAIGPVTDLVAPNAHHTDGIALASQIFPQARVWGSSALQIQRPHLKWTHDLAERHWPYQDEFPMIGLRGAPRLDEAFFFHRASKTLIVCDFVFNLPSVVGPQAWIAAFAWGTRSGFAIPRRVPRTIDDRDAMEGSLRRVFSYDFETLVMSHGDIVRKDARETFERALLKKGLLWPLSLTNALPSKTVSAAELIHA